MQCGCIQLAPAEIKHVHHLRGLDKLAQRCHCTQVVGVYSNARRGIHKVFARDWVPLHVKNM